MQVTDNSANKFKNSYFNDINNNGFAIETSGNAIVHGTIESDDVSANSGNFAAIDTVAATISDSLTSASLNVLGNADISNNLTVLGRIGINTSVPSCSLDISASDALQVPAGFDDDIADISLNTGMFRYDLSSNKFMGYTNDGWIPFFQSNTDDSGNTVSNTIVNGDAGIAVTTISNEIIRFFDGSSIPLIMDGDGNFGIGGMEDGTVRTLNAKLDIYGNVDISGQTNINNTIIDSDGVVNTNGAVIVNNDGNLYFTDGTYIGRGLKTNVLDGASNINIGISNEVYIHYDWQDGVYNELLKTFNVSNVSSIDTHGEYAIVGDSNTKVAYIYHFIDNKWKNIYTLVSGISSFGSSVSIYDGSFTFVGVQSNNSISVYGRGLSGTNSGKKSWTTIACSDDGKRIVAATSDYYAVISTDGGVTWTSAKSGFSQRWTCIASSSDGMKLVGTSTYYGSIFISNDGGSNWERIGPDYDNNGNWNSIASSSDGTKLAAVVNGGYIYISPNSGEKWTKQSSAGSRIWWSITSSSDGTKLAAVVNGGYIYTSTNSVDWIQQNSAGNRKWYSITSSSDGTKLAAVVYGGYIYTSTNSGENWIQQNSAGSRNWYSITSSSDGTKLAAVVYGGYIYISTNSGENWIEQTYAGSRKWESITSSSDGTKLSAVDFGGYIYTSTYSGVLTQDISGSLVSTYGNYTATASDDTLFIYSVGSTSTWTIFTSLALGFTIQSIDLYDNKVIIGGNGHMKVYQINSNSSLTPLIQVTSTSSSFGLSVGIYGNYAIVGDPNGNTIIYNINGNVAATLGNAATSVSINANYAIVSDGNNVIYKYSFDKITNIWNTAPGSIDVSNNLVSIDDYLFIGDSNTAYIYSTVTSNSIPHNAVTYGKDKYLTVGSTAETVFSSNDGIQWSSVITDFSYNSVTGIKKVIIDSSNVFFINEIQVWIDGSNVALNANSSTNVIDNNVTNIDASGSENDYFYGQHLSVILDKNYVFADLQSVVIYNNIEYAGEIDGATLYLKDEYNNVLYQTIIEGSYNYYRYDVSANGPLIGGTGSGEGIIAPIDFSYNKVKFGINNYNGIKDIYNSWYASAALKNDGSVVAWGQTYAGGKAGCVYSSSGDIKTDNSSALTSGVKWICPNLYAFAALKEDGSVIAWGSDVSGGDVTNATTSAPNVSMDLTSGVVGIFATKYAFAALKEDGSVYSWGADGYGSRRNGLLNEKKTISITNTNYSFLALLEDGSLYAWGSNGTDLVPSGNVLPSINNATHIFANSFAFAALTSDNTIYTWGTIDGTTNLSPNYGPPGASYQSDSGFSWIEISGYDVSMIYTNGGAFAALDNSGGIIVWGNSSSGGANSNYYLTGQPAATPGYTPITPINSGAKNVYANYSSFVALMDNNSLMTWGSAENGGGNQIIFSSGSISPPNPTDVANYNSTDSPRIYINFPTDVSAVYSNTWSYAALTNDGAVVTWGRAEKGGYPAAFDSNDNYIDGTEVINDISSGVVKIFSTPFAYAALKDDGTVVTWGQIMMGGQSTVYYSDTSSNDVSNDLTDIVNVYPFYSTVFNPYAFVGLQNPMSVNQSYPYLVHEFVNTFSAVKSDGSVVTWGIYNQGGEQTIYNGTNPIQDVSNQLTGSNITIDVNEIQIWEHIDNSGASVQSLAVTYATNLMSEIQLWAGGENKVSIVETVGASSLNNNDLTDATNAEGGSGMYALDTTVNINDIQSIVVYTPPFDSTSGTPPETFTITLYDAPFTEISSIPSSDFIVAQFSFTPDSSYNIFRIDGDASGTYDLSYSDAPSTTNIIASDASGTNDGFYKVQYIPEIPFTINLAAVPTTNISDGITTVTNNNLSDVSTLSGYNSYITIDLSNVHVSGDLVSVVVYAKNNGINMNYSTIQMLYDDTIVYQYNIFGADASDNYFRFDGPVIDASDVINEESIYYVVDIPGETMIVPWIDICANDVPIISFNNYYRPLDSLIYEQDKFVAAGDNCIFYSINGTSWSGIAFDSINNEYTLIQKDQYFTSLAFGSDKYVAVANNVADITCFTNPADPSTFSNLSISNANVEGWNSVTYGNDKFVGAGNNQMFYYNNQLIIAVDISKNWTSVAYGADIFVAVTPDGSNNHFVSSVDGIVWNNISNISAVDGSWNLVKYTQNIFMAFSDSQYMTSFDGIVWKAPIDISNNDYTDIVAGKDKVVLVTDSGIDTIFYSDLLITNNVNLGNDIDNGYKNSVAIGNGAIVGADNTIVLGNGSQNVGIGTSTPDSNLQVISTEQVSSFACGSANHGGYKVMTSVQIGVTNTSLLPLSNISAETFLEKITSDGAGISISQLADGNFNSMSLMTFGGGDYPNGVCGIQAYNTYTAQASHLPLLINPAGGNVGIGTSTPQTNLHISSGSGANGSCTLTIEADTDNSEDSSISNILFIQDGGNVQTYMGYYYTGNNAGNSFKIRNTSDQKGNYTEIDFNASPELNFYVNTTQNNYQWIMKNDGSFEYPGALSSNSDLRLKSAIVAIHNNFNILDIDISGTDISGTDISGTDISGTVVSIMESIMALQPLAYNKYRNYDLSGNYIREFGFTVQDLIQIPLFRRLITLPDDFDIDTLNDDISGNALSIGINYVGFIPILVKGIQILKENIESLEAQDVSFNAQIAALEAQDVSNNAQIAALEAQVNTQAQEIAALEAQDVSNNAQIAALEAQVNTQAQEIAALEAQDASYNAQIAALEAQVNTQAQEIATRDASYNELRELVERHERYLLILDYKYPDKV